MKNYQFISLVALVVTVTFIINYSFTNKLNAVEAAVIAAQPKPEKVSLIALEEKLAQVDGKLEDLKKSNELLYTTQKVMDKSLTDKLNTLTPVTVVKYRYKYLKRKFTHKRNRKITKSCTQ